jgi:putative copper resistance protein D
MRWVYHIVLASLPFGRMAAPSFGDVATGWTLDAGALVTVALLGGLYATGVRRLSARGRRWPVGRSIAFGSGLGFIVLATQSGLGRYDTDSFAVHMGQHLVLGMAAPLLLALGAPITLALQSCSPSMKRVVLRAVHSRLATVLSRPVVGFVLFGGTLVALYLSPLLELSLRNGIVHALVHGHVLLVGAVFLWPLLGVDVLPRPVPFGARLLAVLAAVPFHAFLGVALLTADRPLVPAFYPSLADQHAAAGILWSSGELLTLVVAAIVFARWAAADRREGIRLDRRLDSAPAS